jgi:hypothetical protein
MGEREREEGEQDGSEYRVLERLWRKDVVVSD